eukprot:10414219-Alexandrium_andersonii.AAC.1
MRRGETCAVAQPLDVTQRATDVGAIEPAREEAQTTGGPYSPSESMWSNLEWSMPEARRRSTDGTAAAMVPLCS